MGKVYNNQDYKRSETAMEPVGGDSGQRNGTQVTSSSYSSGGSNVIPEEFHGNSYDELLPYLERKVKDYRPLTEDEIKKIRRRQRAEGIISGISDAVQSVANLVGTHHYAPNMYNARESMTSKAKARFDKEKADREAEVDRWFNYAMALGRLRDAGKDRSFRMWQTQQSLGRQQRQDAEAAELRPYTLQTAEAKAARAMSEADSARKAAEGADAMMQAKLESEKAKGQSYKARAAASYASAAASKRKDAIPSLSYWDKGRMVTVRPETSDDYKQLVYKLADKMGIDTRVMIGKDTYGTPRYTRMSVDQVAGLVSGWRPAKSKISIHGE